MDGSRGHHDCDYRRRLSPELSHSFRKNVKERGPRERLGHTVCRAGLEWLSLSYLLYSLVLALGMLLSLPFWLYQILRHGKYRRGFTERLGRVPARLVKDADKRVIWVHAVSLGEVLAVSGLVEQMRRTFPQHRVLMSTTTDTGQSLARKRFGDENVFYFPMDFAFAIRPYLRTLQPELVVLAETEFWPTSCAWRMPAVRASRWSTHASQTARGRVTSVFAGRSSECWRMSKYFSRKRWRTLLDCSQSARTRNAYR
jgi:hypothetical protein